MKSSTLFLILLCFLTTSVSYSMEEKKSCFTQIFKRKNPKYSFYELSEKTKKLELMDLPTEMLSHIVDTVIDTGSSKDAQNIFLTNKLLAMLTRKCFSKRLYYTYKKEYSSKGVFWNSLDFLKNSPFKQRNLDPNVLGLSSSSSVASFLRALPLLDDEDTLSLINHICTNKMESHNTLGENTVLREEIFAIFNSLISQARERKLNINVENEEGVTPLMWIAAYENRHYFINSCAKLLQAGADINYKNKHAKTFFDIASFNQLQLTLIMNTTRQIISKGSFNTGGL